MSDDPEDLLRVVGLKYEPAEGLPQLIFKASGDAAEEVLLRRRHSAHAAPVMRNETLLEQLYRLPVDGRIGPELYRAVAVLLAHVFEVEMQLKGDAHA
jgi:type III secretion system FlhB-like substrate exporter